MPAVAWLLLLWALSVAAGSGLVAIRGQSPIRAADGDGATAGAFHARDSSEVASFSATLDHDLYFPSLLCESRSNSSCSSPSIAPCCPSCINSTGTSDLGCFCPYRSESVCLDDSHAVSAVVRRAAPVHIEFGLLSPQCQDLMIASTSIRSPPTISSLSLFDARNHRISVDVLPLISCASPASSASQPVRGHITISWGALSSYSAPQDFVVTAIQSPPLTPVILPVSQFWTRAPPQQLVCPGNQTVIVTQFSYPEASDPPLTVWNGISSVRPVSLAALPRNVLTFSLTLWDSITGLYSPSVDLRRDTDVVQCRLLTSGWTTSNGTAIAPSEISFALLDTPECNQSVAASVLAEFAGILNVSSAHINVNGQLLMRSLSVVNSSREWTACSQLVASFISNLTTPIIRDNSTLCAWDVGTDEYYSDTCCNRSAGSCCQPATRVVSALSANSSAISSSCRTPECSLPFLEAVLAEYDLSACDSILTESLLDPSFVSYLTPCDSRWVSPDGDPYRWVQPCSADSECPSSSPCLPFPLFTASGDISRWGPLTQSVCTPYMSSEIGSLCSPPPTGSFMRSHFCSALDLPSDATDDEINEALIGKFPQNACVNPIGGYVELPVNGSCPCAGLCTCNWNRLLSEAECAETDWRPSFFCGIGAECEYGTNCTEVSRFPGCFYHYGGSRSAAKARCTAAGGIFQSGAKATADLNCWFSAPQSRSACLPHAECPAYRVSEVRPFNQSWCSERCLLPAASASSCTCARTPDPLLCGKYGLHWAAEHSECLFSSLDRPSVAADCASLGGTYWHGSYWQEPLFADAETCSSHGLCTSDPAGLLGGAMDFVGHAVTEPVCSALVGCDMISGVSNRSACAAAGLCSTAFELDQCLFPASRDPNSGIPWCLQSVPGPLQPAAGCALSFGPTVCSAESGSWISSVDPATATRDGCTAVSACKFSDARNSLLFPETPTVCQACGGTPTTLNRWLPATWGNGTFLPFAWRTREWSYPWQRKTVSNQVSLVVFLADIISSVLSVILARDFTCRQQVTFSALSVLTCDCGARTEDCYDSPQFHTVGATLACGGQAASYAPVGSPPSFNFSVSGATVPHPTCATLSFSVAPAQLFSVAATSPFSSLLLSTLSSDPYSVVYNSRGIPIGQLRGDVVQLVSSLGSMTVSGAELCVSEQPYVPPAAEGFDTLDFASWDSRRGFSPLSVATVRMETEPSPLSSPYSSLCTPVADGGVYAPIVRRAAPEETGWADTLTTRQRTVFVVVAVLFGLFLCVTLLRLANALWARLVAGGLWTSIETVQLMALLELITLAVFSLLRCALFAALRAGALPLLPSVGLFALVEIPTHLEFSVAACVLYVWALLLLPTERDAPRSRAKRWLLWGLISAHLLFLAIFLSAVVAFSVVGAAPPNVTSCAAPSDPPQAKIERAYKVLVAVTALLLCLCTAALGGEHCMRLQRHKVKGWALWQFGVVVFATVLGLLLQAVLVFYIAFTAGSLIVLALGAFAELLRPMALLFTVRAAGQWQKDWCFGCGSSASQDSPAYVEMDDDEY